MLFARFSLVRACACQDFSKKPLLLARAVHVSLGWCVRVETRQGESFVPQANGRTGCKNVKCAQLEKQVVVSKSAPAVRAVRIQTRTEPLVNVRLAITTLRLG